MLKEAIEAAHGIMAAAVTEQAAGRVHYVGGDDDGQAAVPWALERDGEGGETFRQLVSEKPPAAAPIVAHTLQAVVDYLAPQGDGAVTRDCVEIDDIFVHVESHDVVEVFGALRERRDRERFLVAKPVGGAELDRVIGHYQAQDAFVLSVQTGFRASPERAELLKLVGNLIDGVSKTAIDDGVTQMVNVKAGAKLDGAVKNPWMLAPLRSFPEIELSPQPFVLRVYAGGEGRPAQLALFDASGGAWRVEAISKIAAWLKEKAGEQRAWGLIA